MTRSISEYEMSRRIVLNKASERILNAMSEQTKVDPLTTLEWIKVLSELQNTVIAHGINQEWRLDPHQ